MLISELAVRRSAQPCLEWSKYGTLNESHVRCACLVGDFTRCCACTSLASWHSKLLTN